MGWEVRGRFKGKGTYVYLRLTYVDIWQKTKQYYGAIILQLKINFKKTEVQYIISNLRITPSISFYFYLNKLKNYLGQVECFSIVDLFIVKRKQNDRFLIFKSLQV